MDLIVIPSMGRAKRQQTLYALYRSKITESYRTVVCVYPDEEQAYKRMSYKGKRIKGVDIVAVPKGYKGIAQKRQFILTELAEQYGARYVYMLDDDLSFCWRPDLDKEYMPYINDKPFEMHCMVETLTMWLEQGFAHVGLISRQANRIPGIEYVDIGRLMNAHAYDTHVIKKLAKSGQLKFNRVPLMEDFDITLQLLKAGYPNRISCKYSWTTVSNIDGGCSSYRTNELQAEAARKLKELHDPYVILVKRKSKSWQNNLTERIDVRVFWQKAYKSSQQSSRKRLKSAA